MRETSTLEFKEAITNTFLKTVSAYANFGGGRIIFGVDDNGQTVGLPSPLQAVAQIENKINDSIDPHPDFQLSINDKENTVTLEVFEGPQKPYLYKLKAYRRSDSSTIEVDTLELRRLIMEGDNLSFDQLKTKQTEFDFSVLKSKFQTEVGLEEFNKDTLRTLELFTSKFGYNNAAALLSDHNSFPGIDIARFGESINQIRERITLEKESILKEFDDAMQIFRRNYVYEEIKGIKRSEKQSIPEEAFREAIVNALVHRTWDVNAHIKVALFPSYIEITSPGGLLSGVSREDYLNGKVSILRNPIVGNVFYRLGFIERYGTGVTRIKQLYAESATKPIFNVTHASISVILPLTKASSDLPTEHQAILNALQANLSLSSSEIVSLSGFSKTKVVRLLNELVEMGYVEAKGNGRGRSYSRV